MFHHNFSKFIGKRSPVSTLRLWKSYAVKTDYEYEELLHFSRKKQNRINMKLLMETGSGDLLHSHATNGNTSADAADIHQQIAIQVACFLHRELPIRLAHRAVELESIPIMCQSKHVMQVANWYKESFRELRETEAPTDAIKEAKFAHIVQSIFHRHSNTLLTMAKGAHEIRQILKQDVYEFAEYTEIQNSLEWFYMSRIGIRMLICQYLALKSPPNEPDMIGLISTRASPLMIANDAIRDTTYVCTRTHGEAPEVQIHGRTDLTFPYVSYLRNVYVHFLNYQ